MALREAQSLRLRAQGHDRLEAWIEGRLGEALGRYEAPRLADFGAESLILKATDPATGRPVALKLPFLDYADAKGLDLATLERRRAALAWEVEVLEAIGRPFPALVEAFEITNPLLPRSLPPRLRRERVAALEWLEARPLAPYARRLAQAEAWEELEAVLSGFARASLTLAARIEARYGPQMLYADLKLENACLIGEEMRFFDAGSLVDLRGETFKFSPLYVAVEDWSGERVRRPEEARGFFRRSLRRCVEVILAGDEAPPRRPCHVHAAPAAAALARLTREIEEAP